MPQNSVIKRYFQGSSYKLSLVYVSSPQLVVYKHSAGARKTTWEFVARYSTFTLSAIDNNGTRHVQYAIPVSSIRVSSLEPMFSGQWPKEGVRMLSAAFAKDASLNIYFWV
jgi:hypothetical protein